MLHMLRECQYNENDPKFQFLSNFTKFTMGKQSGLFDTSLESMIEFLKYEYEHQNRPLIISRLVTACLTQYKARVMEELAK